MRVRLAARMSEVLGQFEREWDVAWVGKTSELEEVKGLVDAHLCRLIAEMGGAL
jgi:hypothetical protein